MTLRFREAIAADAVELSALAREAKAHWGYPACWLATWRHDPTLTGEYLERHRVFPAADGGRLVGVCALEDHATHWALEHVWVLPSQAASSRAANPCLRPLPIAPRHVRSPVSGE